MKEFNSMNPTSANPEPRFMTPTFTQESVLDRIAVSPARRLVAQYAAMMLPEETMVVDDRSHLTPAQMVETKLIHRLKSSSLPVSQLQMRGMVRNRFDS